MVPQATKGAVHMGDVIYVNFARATLAARKRTAIITHRTRPRGQAGQKGDQRGLGISKELLELLRE